LGVRAVRESKERQSQVQRRREKEEQRMRGGITEDFESAGPIWKWRWDSPGLKK
jgi:hypothetical protein